MKGGSCRKPSRAVAALFIPVTLLMLTFRGASGSHKMTQTSMTHATASAAGPGHGLTEYLQANILSSEHFHVWLLSLVGSVAVGLSGIFPLLVIPIEAGAALKTEAGGQRLKQLLSFAIGGLLGDVFLHLLPEAWERSRSSGGSPFHQDHHHLFGLWVILGLLAFLLLEKMFPDRDSHEELASNSDLNSNSAVSVSAEMSLEMSIPTCGYLNLLANCIDNFTHGLAVAGSFLVSKKVGFLTTFAILLHEIPHEVGDFAILLRAGFDRCSAARMQLSTALVGVLGACFALCSQSPKGTGKILNILYVQLNHFTVSRMIHKSFLLFLENATAWILPFTSGGFLYIALVNVVPDLLEESSLRYASFVRVHITNTMGEPLIKAWPF
uniref:Zinc transporter ZIP13 n=1 Tax=Cyclopterus lumpus TaxID=8103 RepID=A0A8C2YZT9_CYCLU